MFTGIVETTGTVQKVQREGSNIHFTLSCPFAQELKIDQSLAHNGCCLTVVALDGDLYTVTAIDETLEKTNLKTWAEGTEINLERCMKMNGRLDGHIVQGHVDTTGRVQNVENRNGSQYVTITYEADFLTVPQGSITVNGISLTVAASDTGRFSVAIIPYTWEFTNMKHIRPGDLVNLEFDIIGKYITQLIKKQNANQQL